jgi:hypothetical protein
MAKKPAAKAAIHEAEAESEFEVALERDVEVDGVRLRARDSHTLSQAVLEAIPADAIKSKRKL